MQNMQDAKISCRRQEYHSNMKEEKLKQYYKT